MTADGAGEVTSSAVVLNVNGVRHQVEVDHRTSLLDLLRERLHLTGTCISERASAVNHGQRRAAARSPRDRENRS